MNIKIKKGNIVTLFYLLVMLLFTITKKSIVLFGTCFVTLLGLSTSAISLEMAFIFSVMVGNEFACFVNIFICIFFCLKKKKISKIKCDKNVPLLVMVLLLMALVNMAISGALFNTLFGIIYYCIVLLIAVSVKEIFDEKRIVDALKIGIISQIVCGLVIIFLEKQFSPGDIHCGTFSDANYSVIFLITALYYIIKFYSSYGMSINKIIKELYIYIIGTIVFIILGSAKNVLVGFIVAVVVYAIANKIVKNKLKKIICGIIIVYIALFCGIMILHSHTIKSFFMEVAPQEIGIYIYNNDYSYKYDYFEGTVFEELMGPRMLFGYGIGQYGSRVANMFGYNSMYREDNSINRFISKHFKEQILPNYKKYASNYSQEIAAGIRWRSAILTYPFSSVIAFLAETGVFGLFSISYIWGRAGSKSKYGFLVIFLFSICIFDIYFDHISVTALIVVLLLSDKNAKKLRYEL